jgi:cytoskeletal protein RodZ
MDKTRRVSEDWAAVKKHFAMFAVVLAGLFSGGAALALTADSPAPTSTDSSSSSSSDSSSSSSTDSSDSSTTDSSDSSSTESTDSESSDTGESSSSESQSIESNSDSGQSDSQGDHPANHGADVSSAAHSCPKGPHGAHGKCVSAVAHTHS